MTKTKSSHLFSHRLRRRKGDTHELAARLAPLEELLPADAIKSARPEGSKVVAQENGAIVVGRQQPTLPEDVIEVSHRKTVLGLEPVVIAIVGLMLVFILFITWQISRM